MKGFLFALALIALPCAADTITYSQWLNPAITPSGRHVEASEMLTVPEFDPSLGTLNFVSFWTHLGGQLTWEQMNLPGGVSFLDFSVDASLSAFGATRRHYEWRVAGWPGYYSNNNRARSNISDGAGANLRGKIADGSSSVQPESDGAAYNWLSGLLLDSLDGFYGDSTIDIPVSLSIDAAPDAMLDRYIGNLTGPQSLTLGFGLAYDYTPGVRIESIAVAPEPELSWLLVGALVGLVVQKKRLARTSTTHGICHD